MTILFGKSIVFFIENSKIEFLYSLSWYHKKQFILSIVKNINCFDTLVRIISYIGTLFGKLAAYSDVSPQSKNVSDQILVDHDRAIEESSFKG